MLNLIIDLRNNGGGRREFASELVPYLIQSGRKGILYQSLGYQGKSKRATLPNSSPYAFKGRLIVLINGNTFSNGSVLAAYAKEFADAIVIGEESASRYEGFAAGSNEYITLPNTLIEVRIPRYWIQYPNTAKQQSSNRGVLPAYEVNYNIEEILDEVDKEMDLALKLVEEMRPEGKSR